MKNPSCFWHHLIFNPHPPFSRPAAGSGFFVQKLANFCAVGPAITRARAHSTSRGRGVLIGRAAPVVAGRAAGCCWLLCRASEPEIRRGGGALSAASSGGLRPHRGGAEVFPGRTDPQRGGIIQHSEGGAASLAGRCWRSPEEKENRQGGPCGLLCLFCCLPLFSLLSGGGVIQCGRRWRRSAPQLHVSRNAAGVLFTG